MGNVALKPTGDRSGAGFAASALDEAFGPDNSPKGSYAALFGRLDALALDDAAGWIERELERRGVVFGGADPHPFAVDPVPRLIEPEEWEPVEAGLIQRVRALNEFLADVYGEGRILAAGEVPRRVVEEADWYEPVMARSGAPRVRAHVAGPDLVRCPDGVFRVLEDNLRAPSGLTYLLAAREAVGPLMLASGLRPRGLDPALEALRAVFAEAAPGGRTEPTVVLLSDGVGVSSAYYEHRELARLLDLRIATVADLHRDGDRLLVREPGEAGPGQRVDVIYRRIDDEGLTARDGSLTELGELLVEPLLAGELGCVNSPGSGVADDKAVHVYVERMIAFYLGEEPLLESVRGYDLGDPKQREVALPRLEELVIKPRSEFGGSGVLVGPLASEEELRSARALVEATPEHFVAQEPVPLSTHPTVVDGELRSRHVDLRAFVITADTGSTVVPGGLTRFARGEGEMVVNSGRGGGAKDTWVLKPEGRS